ncbi:MAG: AmmeMemoRadiSam system radical SAM enzyme [Succinivibrionaceae bacterium]|nr:AmmeMemoRadiSam system radical SAM enzyme [Succinivibrionaceae bacterium]
MRCPLCHRHCALAEGQVGICGNRRRAGEELVPCRYALVSSLALDPIEKKPLYHFHPGGMILSVGGLGCNLRCPFCQNHGISMPEGEVPCQELPPEDLVALALRLRDEPAGNLGVAFTYNEPTVSYEYVRDCAALLHEAGLLVVLVTNGQLCREPLTALLPNIDAMNVDLKGYSEGFYRYVGGSLATVKEFIGVAHGAGCHLEITTLIIPGRNDDEAMMEEEARWLASLSPAIPLHLSRYFPRFHESAPMTPRETLERLAAIARRHLAKVHLGNC